MIEKHENRTLDLPPVDRCRIAVLSDTHGNAHPTLFPILQERRPSLILHAGDVGNADFLKELERIAVTIFVRGNVDPPGPGWPDSVSLRMTQGGTDRLHLLLIHFAAAQMKLDRKVLGLLHRFPAQMVVFGHSHIPFIGMDGKIGLFNPGSAGPRRWGLPTTIGLIELSDGRLGFEHLDLRTGTPWRPK